MSGGGVFQLLTNDGKCDKLIMATDFLNRRIQHIMCARKAAGESDIMPTLKDVEKTHLLFVNAHFKPFCAMGHEYQKVRPNTGSPALGNTVTFAIPQFGDFFADMVMRVTMPKVSSSVQTAPTQGTGASFPTDGLNWDGSAFSPSLPTGATALYTLVDAFDTSYTITSGLASSWRNLVRYVEFPGERICQEVKFDVNGNSLDLYEDVATVMMRKFTLTSDKTVGYKRLCGQEVELEGVSGVYRGQVFDNDRSAITASTVPPTTSGTAGVPDVLQNNHGKAADTPAAFLLANFPDSAWGPLTASTAALNDQSAARTASPDSVGYQSVFRKRLQALDGLQTPKYEQPSTDLWCKLRFWFNERIDQAVPSVAIPSGQRFISVKLATQSQMIVEAPGLYIKRVIDSGSDVAAVNGSAVTASSVRSVEYRPYISAGTLSTGDLSNVELYVNNLFVNPEIHDIYISRIGFSLIRVFRMHKQTVSTPTNDDRQLSQLKWPIEYMFVGLRPVWNGDATNTTMHRDWHRMCKVVDIEAREPDRSEATAVGYTVATGGGTPTLAATFNSSGVAGHSSRIHKLQPDRFTKELKTFDTLSLTAHGVKIFDTFSEKFFSAYVPYAFGGPNIVTPQDEGCLMFNFALYPGVYQPSGHINVSRAREFYLNWSSAYTTSTTSSELIVIARAINFLLVANGSCVLRFTT